ncbi:NAD(P)H oxidoreductase [Chitinophaga silvatica]|uniref:NAD(P)H oxidoreductase n=1 Tax=Chitinophaga silvatica TaxID=2282649 RepID=A0A3E1YAT5_9BACT|nr:NAD(P)H-dependent oxidoreductase [Chitinophaga silvatica]RFS23030.1 NAD(P)H oxidoreductase [Chitinophaga silvatica]
MASVLINFAHPALEKSRVHAQLMPAVKSIPGVTFNDLYENYPDLDINVAREQKLLLSHDIILFQHPFYWYSAPAIIKQWIDLVLEHGWAYGRTGKALQGKVMGNIISVGGPEQSYSPEGHHQHTIHEFLLPFRQTARLCNMEYAAPFVVFGVHKYEYEDIREHSRQLTETIKRLQADNFNISSLSQLSYLYQILQLPAQTQQ